MADNTRLEELKRRVQQDPASIAFAALAEEYRRSGRFDEAIATCTAGLQRHPSYLSAHVTLGRALIEVGRYEDATEELQFVLRLAPENLAAIRGLAEIQHRRGEDASDAPLAPAVSAAPPGVSAPIPISAAPPAPPPLIEVTLPPPVEAARPVAPHPALVGLEAFLGAIVRARAAARP
jgi:tetratricopeptide (TPR) repeat protein